MAEERFYTAQMLLETYPTILKWHNRTSKQGRAKLTADIYLRRLALFCDIEKTDPMKLLEGRREKAFKTLKDHCYDMLDRGLKPSHTHGVEKAVKSWFAFNDKSLKMLKIDIEGKNKAYRETSPDQETLARILRDSDKRTRAMMALLAFAGVRPQVLGNYGGTDGLIVGDVLDMVIDGKKVRFEHEPAVVQVRDELSKSKKEYLSFIPREGCVYLREYLQDRMDGGEVLEPGTALFSAQDRGLHMKNDQPFLTTKSVSQVIRRAFHRSNYQGRPYVLRTYFSTNTLMAIQKKDMTPETRSFLMGHKGDMDRRYAEGRGNANLSKDIIDEMRSQYLASEEWLCTQVPKSSREQIEKMVHKQIVLAHVMDCLSFNEEQALKLIVDNNLLEMRFDDREKFLNSQTSAGNATTNEVCFCCNGSRIQVDNAGLKHLCPACNGKGRL